VTAIPYNKNELDAVQKMPKHRLYEVRVKAMLLIAGRNMPGTQSGDPHPPELLCFRPRPLAS